MPVCRSCHSRISKFDADRCPVCGCEHPLEGVTSETIEITSNLELNKDNFKDYHPTKKIVALLLFIFFGFIGLPFFYLKYTKQGLVALLSSLIMIGGLGSILTFLTPLNALWGYLIPTLICYLFYILIGVLFLSKSTAKDGRGEFIK